MPTSGKRYQFNEQNVGRSPDTAGVYALFDAFGECIYIGRAKGGGVTIRSRLQAHLAGHEGACTQRAVTYAREVTTSPVSREVELLEEFRSLHGRLPRCNSRIG